MRPARDAWFRLIVSVGCLAIGFYAFILPAGIIVAEMLSGATRAGAIPASAFRWHRHLAPRFENWARERIGSERAAGGLAVGGVAGTEWPLFSAVFFLWASEELEAEWQAMPGRAGDSPAEQAAGAIEAAAELLTDPVPATWVKTYWGEDYLSKENLFYRMLLINGLCSYQRLTGNRRYEDLLRDQTLGLKNDINHSVHGLIDDYPGQCYPIDIIPAIAGIQRSLALLGEPDSSLIDRSLRGFTGRVVDPATGLPSYFVDANSGRALSASSGVGGAFMSLWATELWPEQSRQWYDALAVHFWQRNFMVAGFREKRIGLEQPWFAEDVDAGPVLFGFGTAASTFGMGAARVHGRMDHALPLMAEAMVAAWPLPSGRLVLPRLLAHVDAPHIGDTVLLFSMTRRPAAEAVGAANARLPLVVYVALSVYLFAGYVFVRRGIVVWRGSSDDRMR